MFFRFGAAMLLIVAVSLLGIAVEKRTLALKRTISLQLYRTEQLRERNIRLRLRCEQLGAPARLLQTLPSGQFDLAAAPPADQPRSESRRP